MRVPTKRPASVAGRGGEKAADFFRQMLAVGIEQDDVFDLSRSSQWRKPVLIDSPLPTIHADAR